MPLATLDNKWRMEGSDWTAEKTTCSKSCLPVGNGPDFLYQLGPHAI